MTDERPSQPECECVPVTGDVALSGGCPAHDPVLMMLRGEPVKFAGVPARFSNSGGAD